MPRGRWSRSRASRLVARKASVSSSCAKGDQPPQRRARVRGCGGGITPYEPFGWLLLGGSRSRAPPAALPAANHGSWDVANPSGINSSNASPWSEWHKTILSLIGACRGYTAAKRSSNRFRSDRAASVGTKVRKGTERSGGSGTKAFDHTLLQSICSGALTLASIPHRLFGGGWCGGTSPLKWRGRSRSSDNTEPAETEGRAEGVRG